MPIIPHIYNLTLENVNETISAINNAFDALGSWKGKPKEQRKRFEWSESVGASTTELIKDGLNISRGVFDIHAEFRPGATVDYYMYFNRDKTAANYRSVRIHTANGAAVSQTGADSAFIASGADGDRVILNGRLQIDKQNDTASFVYQMVNHPTDLFVAGSLHWEDFQAFDSINSISIVSSVVGHIGKGSHFNIWEIDRI